MCSAFSGKVVVLAVAFLSLPGCAAKLTYDKTIPIKFGEVHELTFDEPLVEKATVTVKSPGAPVSVYIVYPTHAQAAKDAMQNQIEPKDKIVGKKSTEGDPFDFSPGKKPFVVLITPVKKSADVQVIVTSK